MNDRPRYDGLADWYDAEIQQGRAADVTATALQSLIRHVGSGPGKCLDVGCGTGIALSELSKLGWSVVGIDISADQLRIARKKTRGSPIELREADASHLPFPSASFDAVVSVLTHSEFDDPAAAFGEACRVLRPGGKLVYVGTHRCFVTPYVEENRAALSRFIQATAGAVGRMPAQDSARASDLVLASTIRPSPTSSMSSSRAALRSTTSRNRAMKITRPCSASPRSDPLILNSGR